MFENVNIVLSLLLAVAPVLMALCEYGVKKGKMLFPVLNAVYFAAACLLLLAKEGTLACMLIAVMITLAFRLALEIFGGRKDK